MWRLRDKSHCAAVFCAAGDAANIHRKATAPQPPANVSRSSSDPHPQQITSHASASNSVPKLSPDVATTDLSTRLDDGQSQAANLDASMSLSDLWPPEGLGAVMVEHVRRKTGLSHTKSQVAVATVLNLLAEQVSATEKLVIAILEGIHHQHVCVLFLFRKHYTCLLILVAFLVLFEDLWLWH